MEIKKKILKKTAIILCGGKGTRLGKLGKKLPKTLVKIQNKENSLLKEQYVNIDNSNEKTNSTTD